MFFPKKTSKRSFGHVEFNFCNTAEILSQKSKMLLLKVCKRWKNYQFSSGKDSRNVPLDTLAPFLTTLKKFSAKMPKCFPARVRKKLKQLIFSQKFSSVRSSGYLGNSYEDPAEVFCQKSQLCC